MDRYSSIVKEVIAQLRSMKLSRREAWRLLTKRGFSAETSASIVKTAETKLHHEGAQRVLHVNATATEVRRKSWKDA